MEPSPVQETALMVKGFFLLLGWIVPVEIPDASIGIGAVLMCSPGSLPYCETGLVMTIKSVYRSTG